VTFEDSRRRNMPSTAMNRMIGRKPIFGKRLFDIIASVVALVILSPLMGLVVLAVRITSSGPVIYKGTRVGLAGRDFEIFKFRTMWDRPSEELTTAMNDARVTSVGRVLRRYKLDELPQLGNVLRGDMSIVGPRPEFRRWVDLYGPRELAILSVRPGITDFASLEFIRLDEIVGTTDADRRYLSEALPRKNALRLRYVEEMGWKTDLRLIRATAIDIFRRK
jgi:lipopolysaccharide/colanic/teichoic acid biosynthesis glycosyltransferase